MRSIDEQMNRLFRRAERRDNPPGDPMPFGLEARVLAAWREADRNLTWDSAVLGRGLLFASLIMGMSLWPALDQKNNFDSTSLQFADSSVQTDYP